MAFNFGNTSTTFGTPQNKPTAYGTPLSFGTPATAAQTGFGGFGSTFGSTAVQQPTFGATATQPTAFGGAAAQPSTFGSAFGQPAAAAPAPAFGSTFGPTATPAFGTAFGAAATSTGFGSTFGTSTTAAPAFGSTFGTAATSAPAFGNTFGTATSTAPAFGSAFGATGSTAPSLFGTPAVTKPSLFGTPATTAPSLFGAPSTAPSLFGANTANQAPNIFGSAGATAGAPNLFGTSTSAAPSLFNTSFGSTTTTTPSLFGGTGTTGFGLGATSTGNTGFGLFGGTATTATPSLFGGFGKTTTTGNTFTGFGTGTTGFSGFGTSTTPSWGTGTSFTGIRPPGALGTAQPPYLQQTLSSFYAINVYGDERDAVLKKWNMLQACWGTGKGFYNAAQPPIDYNFANPLYRFKAVGYVIIPGEDNTHGLVKLIFNKKESELSNQKEVLTNGILNILGNKPNLTVLIDHIKAVSDNQSEVMFCVSEKGVTGSSRKIPALDLCAFLNQPIQKQQLTTVGVTYIGAYVTPTKAQLQEYLKNPPSGVETQMWQAAQADNPNPQKFMPTPLNGYGDLKKRLLHQQFETNLHQGYLNQVGKDIVELKKRHVNSVAKINELKQKYAQLHHRLLKIIIKQEATRKVGMAIQPEEELLRGRLEMITTQLSLPTQFKGQLHEIRCSIDLAGVPDTSLNQRYKMDAKAQEDIKQFLKMEQNGIAQLVKIVNADLKSLKIITEGLLKMKNN